MSGLARSLDAKLRWLAEPFAGTCIKCYEKVNALAPHVVLFSDNPLGKKLTFPAKSSWAGVWPCLGLGVQCGVRGNVFAMSGLGVFGFVGCGPDSKTDPDVSLGRQS